MTEDVRNLFRIEDFSEPNGTSNTLIPCFEAAQRAQIILNNYLAKHGTKVFACWKTGDERVGGITVLAPEWHWLEGKPGDTHEGTLIGVKQIGEKSE